MSNQPAPKKGKSHFNLILGLILGALGVILILQNGKEVEFNLWFWKITTSLLAGHHLWHGFPDGIAPLLE